MMSKRKRKLAFYQIVTFDGRYNPRDKFKSLKAALNEAKRLFGWKRIYTAHCGSSPKKYWFYRDGKTEGLEISDKPSTLYRTDYPIIERHFS